MAIINKLKSNKKRYGLIISLLIILIGIVPLLIFTFWADPKHPYTIEQVSLTSGDGTKLTALVYKPVDDSRAHGGIVNAHGFCGNKQHGSAISIELVKRGFTIINIDFRGHGSSEGYLGVPKDGLYMDMMVAIEYLERLGNINKIGLIGHSMGGGAAFTVAASNPNRIDAIVAIGSFRSDLNPKNAPNLLLAVGLFEETATPSEAIIALRAYTGETNAEIGKLYGNFNDRSACKLVIGPTTEHLMEPFDPVIIYETVQWFELAFNKKEANDIQITVFYQQLSYRTTLIGVICLLFVLIVYLSNYIFKKDFVYPEKKGIEGVSITKLILYYVIATAIGILLSQVTGDTFKAALPVSRGDQLFSLLVGNTIGIIIVYYFISLRKKELHFKDIPSKIKELMIKNYERSIVYGIIVAILACTLFTLISHWNNTTTLLTAREIGTVIMMTILFFPFLILKEFYFRTVQGKLKSKNRFTEYFSMTGIGILMDSLLFLILMILTWGESLALSMAAIMAFSIIQQVVLTWVYMHSGRNILGSAIFLSIFYAWMIVNFFPFGLN